MWRLLVDGNVTSDNMIRTFETRDECEDAYNHLVIDMYAVGWTVTTDMWIDTYSDLYYRSVYLSTDNGTRTVIITVEELSR